LYAARFFGFDGQPALYEVTW